MIPKYCLLEIPVLVLLLGWISQVNLVHAESNTPQVDDFEDTTTNSFSLSTNSSSSSSDSATASSINSDTQQWSRLQQYNYSETLRIQPFPRNRLLTSFEFESYSDAFHISDLNSKHKFSEFQYGAFPRSLGQVLEQSQSQELHLRFSQGWWDAEGWGAMPRNGSFSGGIGVEVWGAVEGETAAEAQSNWSKLVNSLSGLFCASLNFIDSAQTVFPKKSFAMMGANLSDKKLHMLRGSLPREPVCTENLTPFIKLLPCKGKAGISSLLDGHKIFDAQWQGMAIDAFLDCEEESGMCKWRLMQVIDVMVDVPRSLGRKNSPIPKPLPGDQLRCDPTKPYNDDYRCFPLGEDINVNFLLSDIFGKEIAGECPLCSNTNHIVAATPSSWGVYITSSKEPGAYYGTATQEYALQSTYSFDLNLRTSNSSEVIPKITPAVYMERSFTGYGLDRGGIRTEFTNPLDEEAHFVYLEVLPWYMRPYLHTLQLEELSNGVKKLLDVEDAKVLKNIVFSQSVDRQRPTQFEIEMVVGPRSSVVLNYDFDKSLLFIEEYPPDANHGFEIAPAVLTLIPKNSSSSSANGLPFSIRTTSLLLTLPTPDFSMPYNVIILTCTVMALGFGSVFNLLVKRVVTEEEIDALAFESPLRKKLAGLKEKLGMLLGRKEQLQRGPFPYEPRKTGVAVE